MADFEERRIDVLAEEGMIAVEALGTRNGQLVVRAARAPEVDWGAGTVAEREPFSM